ncbi:MAG: choice-of-anchor A family protein, partial [Ruminococcus sp.]|nr:choice-of-anchor A family protein [Ruminococcus sp.]
MKKDIPIREKSLKVRFLSALTSVMILMMTVVPSLTVSADEVRSINGELATTDVTLLVGDGNKLAEGASNASDVIDNADKTYLLGIASQFCVFLQDDFTVTDADAEGRVAVGGIVSFGNYWDYQIGQGDFETSTAIEYLTNIDGNSIYYEGAAHLVTAGNYFNNLHTQSFYSNTYKIFAVGEDFSIANCRYVYNNYWDVQKYIYPVNLIDFDEEFQKLESTSNKIANKSTNGIAEWDGTTLNLTCTDSDAEVVYFNVSDWTDGVIEYINYIDIPDGAYIIVTCDDDSISIYNDTSYYIADWGKSEVLNSVTTTINGETISKVEITEDGMVQTSNNNVNSERILYNFPNASTVYINANFNGTILAPDADVTSAESCDGHLSGALITKSFSGGLEFGYRPYQGGIELISSGSTGYSVPISKVDENGDGLAGATLGLYDENGSLISTWKSTDGTDYITIPTAIDFSGDTEYTAGKSMIDTIYTIKEITAPTGYSNTDLYYTVELSEGILALDSDGIPIETSAILIIYDSDGNYVEIYRITSILDTYNDEGTLTNRKITIEGTSDVTFNIGFNDDGGVTTITDTDFSIGIADVNESTSFTYSGMEFYYDANNYIIMPAIETLTFVNEEVGATVQLEKVDQDGNNLSGATVDIYAYVDSSATNDVLLASDISLDTTTNQDNTISYVNVSDYITNETYITSDGKLKPGVYYIVENTAPKNAILISGKQYFKVNDDGSLTVPYDFSDLTVESPTTYNISQMAFNDNSTGLTVNSVTFYYADGTSSTISQVEFTTYNDYWHVFNLGSVSMNNIIGIELDCTGTDTRNLLVQDTSWQNIDDLSGYVSSGITLFGTDTVPTVDKPTITTASIYLEDSIIKFENEVEETIETFDVTISKVDVTNGGTELEGAILTVTSNKGIDLSGVTSDNATLKVNDDKVSVSFTSTTTDTVLSNLPCGEYTLSEVTAPSGYATAESITFVINDDGTITIDEKEVTKVVMEDEVISVTISKVDATNGGTELEGATLTVTSNDGIDLSGVTSNNTLTYGSDNTSVSFTSTTTDIVLSNLPCGKYTLSEVIAPDGYATAEN